MRAYDLDHSDTTPYMRVVGKDSAPLFINFCSLVCILHCKKLNLANIFLILLKEEMVLTLYLEMCEIDSKYDALKQFLEYDSTLHKSKYIKKYLNSKFLKCKKPKRK